MHLALDITSFNFESSSIFSESDGERLGYGWVYINNPSAFIAAPYLTMSSM